MNSTDRFPAERLCTVVTTATRDGVTDVGAGRLDRAVPRAFWRMLQIGERAGIIGDVHRAPLLELFVMPALPSRLERVLRAFEIDCAELYALVTLFSADPQSVEEPVLARECLCEETAVDALLDHLERLEIVVRQPIDRSGRARVALTELGRETAVYAIYRVINAAKECIGSDRAWK